MENEKQYIIKTADQLDNSPVEWLIPDWIPKRGITLLFGDGGTGKSYLWVSLASALSKGNRNVLCSEPSTETKVLCLSGEDAECVLRKRFESANGNLKNIYAIGQDSEVPNITFSGEVLEEIIDDVKPGLLIFDPLQSFIGSNVDMSRRNQMRQAMKPLQALSSKHNMPIVVICHSNKREKVESGRDKLADSADLWDIARSVIMCGIGDNNERYISLEKSSYADHLHVPTVLFNIEAGRLVPNGTVSMKMRDFVRERKTNNENKVTTKKSECEDAILSLLSSDAWKNANQLKTALKDKGYGDKTIKTALQSLKAQGFIEMHRLNGGIVEYKQTED